MKILIFGNKGYIGSEFVSQLGGQSEFQVRHLPSRGFDGKGLTFTELEFLVKTSKPDVVLNCAAYTGGDKGIVTCETRKDMAIASNVIFPTFLGEICHEHGIILGHISTGCFYNGYIDGGYDESMPPNMTFEYNNCSVYTGTKVMAEEGLADVKRKYIWRIRLPFDNFNNPRNYITKLLSYEWLISLRNSLTHRGDFVSSCIKCFHRGVPFGTYNMTNPGALNAEEIVEMIKKTPRLMDSLPPTKEFRFFDNPFDALKDIPRSNTVLNTDKQQRAGIAMRPVKEAMQDSLDHWRWI